MAVVALLFAAPSSAHPQHHPHHCSVVKRAWSPARWRRGQPKRGTVEALHSCSNWATAKKRYYRHRARKLFIQRVTPFYCGSDEITFDPGFYAIPCVNVNAESGGRGGPYCNTYGIIGGLDEPGASSGTWVAYGGLDFGSTACASSERGQSIVAHRILRDVGTAAWTPFE